MTLLLASPLLHGGGGVPVETPSGDWRGRGLEEHAGRGVSAQVGMGGGLFTTMNIIYEINQEGSMRSGI